MISSETINDYLGRLASRRPTPGGGAAAALHAAQGAALVAMVARFTTGKKYEQHEAAASRIAAAADSLRTDALRLADLDEEAFQGVIDSYKHPSETETQRAERIQAIDNALVRAAEPPAELIRVAHAIVELAGDLLDIANPNVISDVAAAADAARAAASTARVNIDINAVAIADLATRQALRSRTDGTAEKVLMAADSLGERVRERILP